MSLSPGSTISSYAITREVGRGGMGVVYLARDTRLDRDVAIKALPEKLASDPVRLERFEREARTLASLSHPNLAGIYGIEEQDGARYLILEYVEGETIADILDRGPLSVDDALELAVQICAGIEAAHEAGVIHRDLKPANIKVTPESKAKVLDFGLARADEGSTSASSIGLSNSPTMTSPVQHSPTIPGAILGTAPYMSPEQARGRKVDKRTDIWSFAVVLYEMLTGIGPFHGETATDSIGAILHKDIDLSLLPANTPSTVKRVLNRCLARDKAQRYRDIADVRIELQNAGKEQSVDRAAPSKPNKLLLPLAAVVAILAGVGAWVIKPAPLQPEKTVRKYDIVTDSVEGEINSNAPRISPDGNMVAYVFDDTLHIRDLRSFDSRVIPDSRRIGAICWSPDSKQIAYIASSTTVVKLDINSGGTVEIGQTATSGVSGLSWTIDDRILAGTTDGIEAIPARGGSSEFLLEVDPETDVDFHYPFLIEDTGVIVFIHHRRDGRYALQAIRGEERITVADMGEEPMDRPTYCASGHILFHRGWSKSTVWAVPFDPKKFEATAEPFLVLNEAASPTVSNTQTLVFRRGSGMFGGQIVLKSRDGSLAPVGKPREFLAGPLMSNDGTKIAFTTGASPDRGDIWVHDMVRGSDTRLTFNEIFALPFAWSPDDSEIALVTFNPAGDQLFTTYFMHSDGSGESRETFPGGLVAFDAAWESAVSMEDPRNPETTLKVVRLDNLDEPEVFMESEQRLSGGALSPDGSLYIYVSNQSGQNEIFCTTFPDAKRRWQVSNSGGETCGWAPDGQSLFYFSKEGLFEVKVTHDPTIQFGIPEQIFDHGPDDANVANTIPVTPDGQHFLFVQRDEESDEPTRISVIENWYEEFREQQSR